MPTIADALDAAVQLHRRGNLAEAERLYREILEVNARQPDAWHLLGLVDYQRGSYDSALANISRAIGLDARQPTFHNHQAEVLRSIGRLPEADASCREALRVKPDFALAHNTLGIVLEEQGKLDEAMGAFREAIRHDGKFSQAYCNLGRLLRIRGEFQAAIEALRQATAHAPGYAAAWEQLAAALADDWQYGEAIRACRQSLACDPQLAGARRKLASLLHAQARFAEAVECYEQFLAQAPNDAETLCNLGSALKDQGQLEQAVACYERALSIEPDLAEARFNLAVVLQGWRRLDAAAANYQHAIRVKPDHAQAHNNLGTIHRIEGRLSEAIACYERALEIQPNFAEVLNNLGNTFKIQGRHAEALVCYEQAQRINPDYPQVQYNHALALLADGKFADGWLEYESRWRCPDFPDLNFDVPMWDGSPLGERRLLVHAEQGLGDTIQFARYLALVPGEREQIFFELQKPLASLFTASGINNLIAKGDTRPGHDLHIPLMSLPRIFGTTLETIPKQVPYLAADPPLVEHWRKVVRSSPGLKVGIAWQGSRTYVADRFRSIPLKHFAPLAQKGVELISLQKGFGVEQLDEVRGQFEVRGLGQLDEEHGAFMDTAAIMKNLDLVITSDTAIPHLAAAMGVPVWLATPLAPDWRWLLSGRESPWYPTMRLFRQSRLDGWDEVFAAIGDELRQLVKHSVAHPGARPDGHDS